MKVAKIIIARLVKVAKIIIARLVKVATIIISRLVKVARIITTLARSRDGGSARCTAGHDRCRELTR